jgi:hypothetical protein
MTLSSRTKSRTDDACRKTIGYLLASQPAAYFELRSELLEQCQEVDRSNVDHVLDATLAHLVSCGAVIVSADDATPQYELADSAFDVNGNYVGPYADNDNDDNNDDWAIRGCMQYLD